MEIRDFAELVLNSSAMADKCFTPETLTDLHPGAALKNTPERPARPAGLGLSEAGGPAFPKTFEASQARGLALHFFANHELLAMELMALMLLRFPDAPAAFRADLARTITEEQEHLRLYQTRMQALGVGLGDVPVNGFFWRVMKDAATPLDFVVQMAMTFEQANLDYCVHYRRLFEGVEDHDSATLLQKVYDDEVGHVMHGVRWFEAWRPKGPSAWQAYLQRLPPTLTAARAKGPLLDVAGRQRAGLSEDFIRHLRVFSASKGRRPRLFVFEPFMEDVWAGATRSASPAVAELTADLSPLVGFLGAADDRVVLEDPPRLSHLEHLDEAGLGYPESQTWAQALSRTADLELAGDRPVALHPWGFTPALAERAQQLCGQVVDLGPVQRCSSKLYGRELLKAYLQEGEHRALYAGAKAALLGAVANSEAEVHQAHAEASGPLIAKAPYSASGRHRVRLEPGALPAPALGFVRRVLREHGALWVAPWLTRLRDLSVTLHVEPAGKVRLDPPLWLINDTKGAYRGHALAPMTQGLSDGQRRDLNDPVNLLTQLRAVARFVGERLAKDGYMGPAGVDLMIYLGPDGQAALHPLLEVNPRYTMGHVAQVLRQRMGHRSQGLVRHVWKVEVQRAGFADLEAWAEAVRAQAPLRADAKGLHQGVVFLTDPERAQRVLAVFSVAAHLGPAQAQLQLPEI